MLFLDDDYIVISELAVGFSSTDTLSVSASESSRMMIYIINHSL
nr:MAG TPA: hypothetical protein [Caudoviricetes sp.]